MRTRLLVSALCFLTLGVFALPLMSGIVAIAPPPPPGVAVPKPSATPFDPESGGEEDSEEASADDESSEAPTDPE